MSLPFPVGSIPWLLAHELRVALRGASGTPGGRSRSIRLGIALVVGVGVASFLGWKASAMLAGRPAPEVPLFYLALDAGLFGLLTLMLAQTLTQSTQAFFVRNDLDLLLSSPISPARVLTVRSIGVAATASLLYFILSSALIIPLLIRGDPRGLALYLVLADVALLATAMGLTLAIALFRVLGPKRTRVVSQVLAALIGASVFLLAQARNFVGREQWGRIVDGLQRSAGRSGFDDHALYAWPARAVMGEPLPLALMTGVCVGVFWIAAAGVGRRFGADAAAAAGVPLSGGAQSKRRALLADELRFTGGPLRTLARKDWRLLIRDPWLLSQMLLQALWFIPLGFVVVRALHSDMTAAAAAPIVFLTGQLAGNLAWVIVSAEDSPELIISAPIDGRAVVRAKLLVALAPVAAVAVIPLLVLAALDPWSALVAAVCCPAAWISVGLMNVWYAKFGKRREMMRRQRSGGGLMALVEMLVLFGWAGTAGVGAFGLPWAAIPPMIILGVLFLLRRPTVYRPALA